MHPGSVIPSRNRFPKILPYVVLMGSNSTRINIWVYFLDYIFHSIATSHNPQTYASQPTSGGPWIPEEFGSSADISWPMSDEGILVSADPSMMELMAEHYVPLDLSLFMFCPCLYFGCVTSCSDTSVVTESELHLKIIVWCHNQLLLQWALISLWWRPISITTALLWPQSWLCILVLLCGGCLVGPCVRSSILSANRPDTCSVWSGRIAS